MRELPKIISVDDHITEPATVWSDRLPSKYADVGPRVHRLPVKQMTFVGGTFTAIPGEKGEEGPLADWWFYEDLRRPLTRLDTAVGFSRDEVILAGITYDEMRQGSYKLKERLEDMDTAGIEASLCFPTFPRFCGQTFYEAKDKELAMLCVRAYNDWMVEEWCGESGGRMLPLCIVPLWDPVAAAAEVRRNAARGVHAVCFSEIAYSEGQIGWIPYILERANNVWEENRGWGGIADKVLVPPSQLFKEHVYGCYFDDPHGLRSLEEIGVDNVTFECDYPHSDSTWPHTAKIAAEQTRELSDEVVYKLMRGNAIKMLSITHLK